MLIQDIRPAIGILASENPEKTTVGGAKGVRTGGFLPDPWRSSRPLRLKFRRASPTVLSRVLMVGGHDSGSTRELIKKVDDIERQRACEPEGFAVPL